MNRQNVLLAQMLVGRKVYDAAGRKQGRVYDMETAREGDELCITALLVGADGWLTRFGWARRAHGRRIPWEHIASLSPDIRLH